MISLWEPEGGFLRGNFPIRNREEENREIELPTAEMLQVSPYSIKAVQIGYIFVANNRRRLLGNEVRARKKGQILIEVA
jgi:hypothetical protein